MPQLLLKLFVDKLGVLALPARKIVKDQLKLHLDYSSAASRRGSAFVARNLDCPHGAKLIEPRLMASNPQSREQPSNRQVHRPSGSIQISLAYH